MFTIGDFARYGLVSVRMLRHYDALGLLRPAHVDPVTGYRFYDASQLTRLNRIVALKGLGFTLGQVGELLDGPVSGERLRGMFQLRQAEQAMAAWIEQHGYRPLGYPREVNLECPPGELDKWVTELQQPVSPVR